MGINTRNNLCSGNIVLVEQTLTTKEHKGISHSRSKGF